ncbi:MAG TPA: TolC family protein [Bryobacteraceae bacterium]|nr:TolC family protein [Bryobacteraceae bacterium]
MLRIITQSDPEAITFLVAGKLVGEWARELEIFWKQAMQEAAASQDHRARIVDLSETLFIDEEGRRVLKELFREGAFFRTACPMMESIVAEITGKSLKAAGHRKLRGTVLAAMVLVAASFAKAQTPQTPLRLTLRDAVGMALKQNPQVQIANLNVAVTQENQIVARSALLPQANLAVSESVLRTNLEAFLGMRVHGFPQHSGPFWLFEGGANGTAPLFDLVAWHRWHESKENTVGARAEEQTVREQDVLLVVSQYLGSLRSSADVSAAQSRVDLAKALFDQASDMQKNGVGTAIDTLRANVQYQNEQQRLIEARTALQTSLFALSRLLNIDAHQPVELADLSQFYNTPAFSADETMERAFAERPEMKTLASEIRAAELERKAARDTRIPRLALNGQWNEEGTSPAAAIPAYTFSAGLTVPLYTGGRIRAEIAETDINLKKLAQQQTDLRNEIAQEVKTSTAQLDAAKTEVDVANQGVSLAKEEVTQARDRFQAGVANNIEVITAQDELSRANDNQIAALYRYNQARADLAHATGQMESLYTK